MRRIALCNTGRTTKAAVAASALITSQCNVVSNNFYYFSARRALTMKLVHTEEITNANNTSERSSNEDRHISRESITYNKEENINSKATHYYDGSISGGSNNTNKTGKKTNSYSSYTNSKVMPYHKVSRGRLAIIRPDLIDEWIPELNAVDVTSVQCSSRVSVWWRCKMCKSKYSAAVRERVVKESRCCPYCHGTGKVVDVSDNKSEDYKVEYEDHHRLSEGKDSVFTDNDTSKSISDEVKANAEEEVKPHASSSNVESELTSELSSKENVAEKPFVSLAMSHPHLIKYWNVTKNSTRTPEMFNANSVESVWWTTPFPLDHNSVITNNTTNSTENTNEEKAETNKEVAQFVTFRRPIASFVIDQMSLQEKEERSAVLEEQLLDIIKKAASLALSATSSLEEKPQLCEEWKNQLKETSNLFNNVYEQYAQRNDNHGSRREEEECYKDNDDRRSEPDLLGTNVLYKEHRNIIDWWSKQHTHDVSHQEYMSRSSSVSDPHGKTKKQTTNGILHADQLCFLNLPQGNKLYTSRVRSAVREELLNQYVQCLALLQDHGLLNNKDNGSYDVNVPLLLLLANSELSNTTVKDDTDITKNKNDNNTSKRHINVMNKLESALQSIFTKQSKSFDVNVLYNSENMPEVKETENEKARSAMSFTSLKLPNAATLHRSFPQLPSSLFNFPSSSSSSSAMPAEQFAFPSTSSLPPESSITSGKTLLSNDDTSNSSSSEGISDIINAMDSSHSGDNEKKQHRSAFALTNENDEVCNKYPQLRKWMPRLFDKSLFTEDAPVETIFAQQRRQSAQHQQQQQGSRLTDDALDEFSNSVTSPSYMQYQQQQQRTMNKRGKSFILFSDTAEMWDDEPLLAEYHRATFVSEHDPRIKFYHDAEEGDIDLASQLRVSGLTNDSARAEHVQTRVYDKRSLVGDAMAALGSNPTLDDDLKALSYVREVMQEVRYPDYRSINVHSIRNDHDEASGDAKSSVNAGPRRTQGKPRTFRLQLPAAPLPVSMQTLEAPREPRKVARRKKRAADHEETNSDSSSSNEKDEVS